MTAHTASIATQARRAIVAFAAANVLGFSCANANTITMTPLQPLHAQSHGAVVTCGSDRAANIIGGGFAEYPAIAQLQGAAGETRLRIDLSEKGSLRFARIDRTSGNRWLDEAALSAARTLRYAPEIADCVPVPGSYGLNVRFHNEE